MMNEALREIILNVDLSTQTRMEALTELESKIQAERSMRVLPDKMEVYQMAKKNKIQAVKYVRETLMIGLWESKTIVEWLLDHGYGEQPEYS